MLFDLTPDQQEFGASIRKFLAARVPSSHVREAAAQGRDYRGSLWEELAGLGVLAVAVPEDLDGAGGSLVDLVPVVEALGHANVPEPVAETAAVAAPVLARHAADPRVADVLRAVAAGEARVGLMVDGSGEVADAARTTHLLVAAADGLHLVASADARIAPLVSRDTNLRLGRAEADLGPATLVSAAPAEVAWARAATLAAAAGTMVGLGAWLIESTVAYTGEREQFGRRIGSFQAVKHQLADAAVELEAARSLAWRAAYALAHDDDVTRWAHLAQGAATSALHRANHVALQLHGGIGFTKENDLHLWLLAAKTAEHRYGKESGHRLAVADLLLGAS